MARGMTARMIRRTRSLLRAGLLPLALLQPGCAKQADREQVPAAERAAPGPAAAVPPAAVPAAEAPAAGSRAAEAPPAEPPSPSFTAEDLERLSPATAAVRAFAEVCAEPARRAVARGAARLGFAPVPVAELDEGTTPGAAIPPDATAWRGTAEAEGARLLWLPGTATCELRARGVDPLVAGAEFARLAQRFEEAGASVMALQPPPARAGAPRTRQMLLVSPGSRPERARVLRLADDAGADAVVLSARGVAAAPAR